MRKYDRMLLLRPDGEWEELRVPRMFNVRDVQEHAPHSDVWLYVPRGDRVIVCRQTGYHYQDGPCYVMWDPDEKEFRCSDGGDPRELAWEDRLEVLADAR